MLDTGNRHRSTNQDFAPPTQWYRVASLRCSEKRPADSAIGIRVTTRSNSFDDRVLKSLPHPKPVKGVSKRGQDPSLVPHELGRAAVNRLFETRAHDRASIVISRMGVGDRPHCSIVGTTDASRDGGGECR